MADDGRAMTVTRSSPPPSPPEPGSPRGGSHTAGTAPIRSPVVLGLVGGAQAALGSLLCVLVPAVVVWMASPTTAAVWTETLRVASAGWLLAHHASVGVEGGHLSLVPLGLTLVPVAWCWSAGRRLAEALAVVGPSGLRRQAISAWAAFAGGYAVLAGVVSLVTGTSLARPSASQAFLGAAVLSGSAGGAALARRLLVLRTDGGTIASYVVRRLRLPVLVRRVLRLAGIVLGAWVAAGAALTVVALLLGWDRVAALREALAPGLVGGLGLTLLDLAYLPPAVLWAAAWLTGAGFSVGAGTAVTPAATSLGPLPAVPLLGALPEPGGMPVWAWTALAVPVLAGVLAGWRLRLGSPDISRRGAAALSVAVAVVVGVGALVLAWMSSGAAGGDRMAHVGPSPWPVALCLSGQVLAGCVLAALLLPAGDDGSTGSRAPLLRRAGGRSSGAAAEAAPQRRTPRLAAPRRLRKAPPKAERRPGGPRRPSGGLRAQLCRLPKLVRSSSRRS